MNVSKEHIEEFLSIFNKLYLNQRENDYDRSMISVSNSLDEVSRSINDVACAIQLEGMTEAVNNVATALHDVASAIRGEQS